MADPFLGAAVIAALLASGSEQGRRAVTTARKHVTWAAGQAVGKTARGTGRAVTRSGTWAGRTTAEAAGRRWERRIEHSLLTPVPLLWRDRPAEPNADPGAGTGPAGVMARPPDAQASHTGKAGPDVTSAQSDRPAQQAPTTPAPGGTTPNRQVRGLTPTAPQGQDRSIARMARRFAINLEPPTTDAEFLSSCLDLGDVLRSLAEEIEAWAEGLADLGLPNSVTTPLNSIAEGIGEAATGAARAANAFADEFEDAREVAARGMKFTGRDAA